MGQQRSRILEPILAAFLMMSVVGLLGSSLGGCGYDGPGAGILISDVPGGTTTEVPPVVVPDPDITNIQPTSAFAGTTVLVSGTNWRTGDAVRFTGAADWPYSTSTVGVHDVVDVDVVIGQDAYYGMVSMIRSTGTFNYQVYDIVPQVTGISAGTITTFGGGTITLLGTGFNWSDPTANTVTIADVSPRVATATAVTTPAGDNTLNATFPAGITAGLTSLTVSVGAVTSATFPITIVP